MEPTLRVYAPGDLCHPRLTGTGPPCPDHWKSVTTLPGYPPEWYLVGDTINRWWGYDSYKIERGPLEKILAVHHRMKVRAVGGAAHTRVNSHLIRIAGSSYNQTIEGVPIDWTWYEHIWAQNPHTHQQWTQADLDSLQVGVGLRYTYGVGWGRHGYCDEVDIIIERGINCPDD